MGCASDVQEKRYFVVALFTAHVAGEGILVAVISHVHRVQNNVPERYVAILAAETARFVVVHRSHFLLLLLFFVVHLRPLRLLRRRGHLFLAVFVRTGGDRRQLERLAFPAALLLVRFRLAEVQHRLLPFFLFLVLAADLALRRGFFGGRELREHKRVSGKSEERVREGGVHHQLRQGVLQQRLGLLGLLGRRSGAAVLRTPPCAVHVDYGQRVRGAVRVQHHRRFVRVLPQVELQGVAVLGGVGAVGAPVLVDVRVRLHVRVEHRLVDARVAAFVALERFRAEVVAEVVLQVVLVFGDERAFRTREQLVGLDVTLRVLPKVELRYGHEVALLALERLHLPVRVHLRNPQTLFVVLLPVGLVLVVHRVLARLRRRRLLVQHPVLLQRHLQTPQRVVLLGFVFGLDFRGGRRFRVETVTEALRRLVERVVVIELLAVLTAGRGGLELAAGVDAGIVPLFLRGFTFLRRRDVW